MQPPSARPTTRKAMTRAAMINPFSASWARLIPVLRIVWITEITDEPPHIPDRSRLRPASLWRLLQECLTEHLDIVQKRAIAGQKPRPRLEKIRPQPLTAC